MAEATSLPVSIRLASATKADYTNATVDINGDVTFSGLTAGEDYIVRVGDEDGPDYAVLTITADSAPATSGTLSDFTGTVDASVTIVTSGGFTGTNLVYSLSGAPDWMTIDGATGDITGTAEILSTTTITVTARNANPQGAVSQTFDATVTAAGVPTTLTLTEPVTDLMSYPEDGSGYANIPVAVTGVDAEGAIIEVRERLTDGGTTWKALPAVSGGATSGTYRAVPQTGGYFATEVRARDATSVTATSTRTVGVGPVLFFEGQSIEAHLFTDTFDSHTPVISTPANNRVQIYLEGPLQNNDTSAANVMRNTLMNADSKRCFTILAAVISGTTKSELADELQTDREWDTNVQPMLDAVYDAGSYVSTYMEGHFNGDAGQVNRYIPFWGCLQSDGSAISGLGAFIAGDGTETTSGSELYVLDHCLFDLAAAANQFGRGVFRRDQTQFHYIAQLNPSSTTMLGQMVNGSGAAQTTARGHQRQWQQIQDQLSTGHLSPLTGQAVYTKHHLTNADATHPEANDDLGVRQHAELWAHYFLDAEGIITLPTPAAISSVAWATDGSDAVVTMTQDITTNEATPSAVTGFEIGRSGGSLGDEGLDWRLTEASTDPATVVLGPGSNQVTITPTTAFANGDQIRFGYGTGRTTLIGNSDATAFDAAELLNWQRYPVTTFSGVTYGVPAAQQGGGIHTASGIAVPAVSMPSSFADADWVKDAAVSVTALTAPWELIDSSALVSDDACIFTTSSLTAGAVYTFAVDSRAPTQGQSAGTLRMELSDSSGVGSVAINNGTGAVATTVLAGPLSGATETSTPAGTGEYGVSSAGGVNTVFICFTAVAGATEFRVPDLVQGNLNRAQELSNPRIIEGAGLS